MQPVRGSFTPTEKPVTRGTSTSTPLLTHRTTGSAPGGGVAEEGEDIEIVDLPFEQAMEMTSDGRIADGKSIMLLQWAALRGPFAL